jgi:hypothetical protein
MDSLPELHIESLTGAARDDAYNKVKLVFLSRLKDTGTEDEIAIRAGFGSPDATHQQLAAWGFSGLLPPHKAQAVLEPKPPEMAAGGKARGSGPITDLPPAANAMSIFQGAIERLSVFVERLPLRREQRQGRRFVVSYAKPLSEAPDPGENYGYLEAPPDAQPDEHGWVRYSLAQAYCRVAGGASRHPDDGLVAAIAAALLVGYSTDDLLDALYPEPTAEIRDQARELFEGDTANNTRRHSLKHKARQIAALMRGYPVGKGDRVNAASKEQQSAAWRVEELADYGYEDDEIARRLNDDDTYLPELKKRRSVSVGDVRDLKSLNLRPY